MKIVAGILGGIMVAVLGAFLVTMTLGADPERGGNMGTIAFIGLWVLSIIVAVRAERPAKAWRRLLLTSAVLAFLLPLSALIFTGSFIATEVDAAGEFAAAEAAGAAMGGGMVAGIMGFIGLFLGVALLVVGLLVGRDKVVYVEKQTE